MNIEWHAVTGWPYEVSNAGQVRNVRTGRILRPQLHKSGYLNVQLWSGGKFWTIGVHQLVATAFLGPLPSDKHEVRHLDGDSTNNVEPNLGYGLHIDNMRDRDRHGTTARGEANGKIKHSDEIVEAARAARAEGLSFASVAARVGVPLGTIGSWLSGRTRT